MRLALAFLVLGLVDTGYHRHEFQHGTESPKSTSFFQDFIQAAAEPTKGEQQTLMGKAICPIVQRARGQGMTDEQIIASAVANHIPQAVIVWAQKNCGRRERVVMTWPTDGDDVAAGGSNGKS